MNLYGRLLKLVKPYWHRLAVAMVCMLGVAVCTAASAYLIKPVLDDIFINKKGEMLKFLSVVVLLVFLVKGVSAWGQAYLMNYVGQSIVARLRQQLYDHLQTLSLSFFDQTPTGVMMSRITNDVNLIEGAVSNAVTGLLKDAFSILGLAVVIFYRDWKLALIAMVVLPFAFYPIVQFGRMLRRISTKSQESMGDISVILHETISGNRIVKAFGMEEYEQKRFSKENMNYFEYFMKSVKVRSLSSPLMEVLGGIGIVFIIWYGGYNVIKGVSTPGNFFSFLAALIMLYEPVKRLSNVNNVLQQGMAAAQRVYDILDTRPEITDKPDAIQLPPMRNSLDLTRVQFCYGNEPVLEEINLTVTAGEIVAIVGVSGAGKTTLVNLIPRFYEVTDGAIVIDGMDIRDVTLASLRSQIGMVTQQTILFNDTVRNNIAYGDVHKSEEDIAAAAKAANAYDFIMKMDKGFDSVIGEQGVRLSGGQRQRLCIARALLKDAPILILDEATSSLDSESELEVQKALDTLMAGRTTLVIAHRLSTIKNADRIVVLSAGKIVEVGRHEDLLKDNREYRRLYELQFAQFEQDVESPETLRSTA
ncbi:MAG: lipid A export permease/ATP-binding protein MsbA [Deltaproteobacteria bacterium]|nr:MAG: lipid A export permease/ATP-binding protein MsbA [Deltaproteobacteria bacterium]